MMRSVSMSLPRSGMPRPLDVADALMADALMPALLSSISRTSTTSPAIAAAATIAGLISSVRPVGLPCRPLKLRFDEDAQTCCPSSLSGFMPRHIEQPAPRHSKPAVDEDLVQPARFRVARLTACEPGTTSAFTCGAT